MKKRIIILVFSTLILVGCGTTDYIRSAQAEELEEKTPDTPEVSTPEDGTIFVQLAGRVNNPGVYEVHYGARLYEAVELAGGLSDDAAKNTNLVQSLSDGQLVLILSEDEYQESNQVQEELNDGLVDINTATVSDFCTLPGIGESKANQIISYRETNGGFTSKEDLMQIPGIKEGTYNKLESYITVR